MPDSSFDVVSKIDLQEASNAIQQALKEILTRFDLKDSKSNIELEKDAIVLHSADEYKLKAVNDILQQKLVKRNVSLKGLTYGAVEPAAGGRFDRPVRQSLQRNVALYEFLLKYVVDRLELVLVGRVQNDRIFFQFNVRLR